MKILICTFGTEFHYACRLFYSLLRDIAEVELFFFNGKWNKDTANFIQENIKLKKPDLVVLSLLTFEFDSCKKFIQEIRRLCAGGDTRIIMGGPHALLAPEACLDWADFVCSGEGEYTLVQLCEQFKKLGRWDRIVLDHISNLIYRRNNRMQYSELQDFYYSRKFIDLLPFPAYGEPGIYFFDGISWRGDICIESNFYYAFSSRGCPYKCSYCINAVYKTRQVTLRSPAKVIAELIQIKQKFTRLKTIYFVDEVFCWQREWVKEFVQLYREYIGLPFECDSFPGRHSEEVIQILAEAGLRKVNIGLQSCSPRVLNEVFMRPQKAKNVLDDNNIYIKHKVLPTYDFIVDNPFETAEELLETVETVQKLERPNFFRIYSLFFFPYHLLTQRAEREGLYDQREQARSFYSKITTTHTGDQCSEKLWYSQPARSIFSSDRKAALNWLLTLYGDAGVPKRIIDFAFCQYKQGKKYWVLILVCHYRFLDILFRYKDKLRFARQIYRTYGPSKIMQLIAKRAFQMR